MKIGVYGSAINSIDEEIRRKASKIGEEIASRGYTLITGACPGLPYEAVLGAHRLGGECIGFSPATDIKTHIRDYNFPIKGFTEIIFIPEDFPYKDNPDICKKYRNIFSVAEIDAAIFIGGRIGSMNEFTLAYDFGKNIGILEGTGGITERAIKILLEDAAKESSSEIIYDSDPTNLVSKLIK